MNGRTRIFFATDVHGSEKTFRKFINTSKVYKVDVLILGGDLTGKGVVPIVEHDDGSLHCDFLGANLVLKNTQEEQETAGRIADIGYYPYRTTQTEMEELKADKTKADSIYVKLMIERLENWLRLAEENLRGTNTRCFITGGNDDPLLVEEILNRSSFVVNPENRVVRVDEHHEMISCAYGNPTPWNTPRELPEDALASRIENLSSLVENMGNCIFNFHIPPVNSQLDTCVKLDTTKNPPQALYEGGQPVMMGAGSSAVRSAIEKHQPLLGLHGHIHESRAVARIGRTCCLNPGSEYGEGVLRGVIVNLTEKKMLSYQFVSG